MFVKEMVIKYVETKLKYRRLDKTSWLINRFVVHIILSISQVLSSLWVQVVKVCTA